MHPFLRIRLQRVVDRQRRFQLSCKLASCWAAVALLGLGLIVLQRQSGWASSLALPVIAALGLVAVVIVALRHRKSEPDWRRLAGEIEARHPDLDGLLLTAVEQESKPGGELNYLQERLIQEAIRHDQRKDWSEFIPQSRLTIARVAHFLALVLFGVVLLGLRTTGGHQLLAKIAETGISVTPGDVSLERGNSLVVLARFGGALPVTVDLVVSDTPEGSRRIPLVKSLADPMFGGSVPEVTSNLVYHVEYAGQKTRDFKVTVFEHPRLERSDADLTYPDYTGQAAKHIKDTRRLSAVEGSSLDLSLQLNKPVISARLVAKDNDKNVIPLTVETNRAVAELKEFPLAASQTYQLQLVDEDNRTNKVPAQFVFEVLKNRAPELKLASPRGDVRPSALEEISFEGTVWDDFGVQAYGLAYSLVGKELQFVELGQIVPAKEKRNFQRVLRLEDLGLEPDQLLSWFVWADDIGPDGQPRRTTGDMYFAEVRPFDEIFREGQGMEGQSGEQQAGQQGNRTAKLAELQKQIINATWKLQREHSGNSSRPTDRAVPPPRKSGNASPPTSDSRNGTGVSPVRFNSETLVSKSETHGRDARATLSVAVSHLPTQQVGKPAPRLPLLQFAGQRAPDNSTPSPKAGRATREKTSIPIKGVQYESDAVIVLDSQAQALEQAEATAERQQDPRTAALWATAMKEMEKAVEKLQAATNSPARLAEALAAEQAAYQALLKLQQHEYQVSRSRNQRQQGGGGGGGEQMQRQLEQMDLTQQENRYETQRQAQSPQNAERREQLQVMNRLQELARRQQDLNERLKELQTALQEAKTEAEREEIRRRLKRLQEEEQQMLADVDEMRQRMDRPENQSRMAEERKQLEQTREDVQRAAEAASQGSPSQALASGTRAQRQLQEMRDQMRQKNSSQFAEDMREMRSEARELARQQDDILKKMQEENRSARKSLSDSDGREETIKQLAQQKARMTNLVERATQVSQEAETAEPLLSRQLYDTVRKFSQDSGKGVKDVQDELLSRGIMTRGLYEKLNEASEPDAAKLMEATSEMLRQDFLPQARGIGQRAQASINDLKRGVERAAESVLGDDTEALRLAQQELDQLTDQLNREIAQAEGGSGTTNQSAAARGGQGTNRLASAGDRQGQQGQGQEANQRSGETAQADGQQGAERPESQQNSGQQGTPQSSQGEQASAGQQGQRSAEANQPGEGQQPGQSAEGQGRQGEQAQSGQAGRGDRTARDGAQRGGARDGRQNTARSGDERGGYGGGRWDFDRVLNPDTGRLAGPIITGDDFAPWAERLRDVEEMIDLPDLRNDVAAARERVRLMRQEFKRDSKKPDWAVVRLQVIKPLVEVRDRIAEELARRQSTDSLVPIDRDPVPNRYSELVRRYYEELGKDK